MKKVWSFFLFILLLSCSDDHESDTETIPLAPPFLQKISHEIAEEVEELRGISRVEGHTLRIDTAAYYEQSGVTDYFMPDLYEPMMQCGFFIPVARRVTLPSHWTERYKFWDGEVGGYFSKLNPSDIHLVLPYIDSATLYATFINQPQNLKTLAHEYTHLLQNQKGLLEKIDVTDMQSLSRSLLFIEGDATFLMDIWGSKHTAGEVKLDSIIQFEENEIDTFEFYVAQNSFSDLTTFLLGHYIYGPPYVAKSYKVGGTDAINQLFGYSISIAEIISGRKQHYSDLYLGSVQQFFLYDIAILAESFGANFISILLNRYNGADYEEKIRLFQNQYGIVSDQFFAARSGKYFQIIWQITFEESSDAELADTLFQQINLLGNRSYRPAVTLMDVSTEGDFTVREYHASNFSTYIVHRKNKLWIIDNPLVHINTILEKL